MRSTAEDPLAERSADPAGDSSTGTEKMAPWLLVFDLDGTLINSSTDLCNSVNAALHSVGRPELPPEDVTSFIGDGAATLVSRALAAAEGRGDGNQDDVFDRAFGFFLDFYREHKLDTTTVYPGVLESLEAMRGRHPELLMAVLTNKPVHPSREICEALGLSRFFFANYGGNSFPTKKPAPEGLLAILEQARNLATAQGADGLSLRNGDAVMIGDSEADVLAGRGAGTRTLGCSYGLTPELLLKASPDMLVDSPFAWPSALRL